MKITRELYGWKYIFDGVGFEIVPDKTNEKPRTYYIRYTASTTIHLIL
jgi:hypothetical protein